MAWFLCGYAGILGFFGLEAVAREGDSDSALAASSDDQDTTRVIVTAYAVTLTVAPIVRRLSFRPMPRVVAPTGVALQALGLGVRAWSMRTLRGEPRRPLIESGPYRLVRHPGYTGSLLIWTGFALTSRSLPVPVFVGAMLAPAYQQRIRAEEDLLHRELPDYGAYAARTKRLIPFVW